MGKTVVVEGFALRVVQGDVPGALNGVEVRPLGLGLLQAGAGIKGEFENRLKEVIKAVKAAPVPIILFIDEAHTMIGAGGGQGAGDAANLLKPALAKGELRTIAATTWAEYKKYFDKDAALSRRITDHPRPVGYGFYHRAWQPKAAFAGTYDDTWRKQRSPSSRTITVIVSSGGQQSPSNRSRKRRSSGSQSSLKKGETTVAPRLLSQNKPCRQ